MKILLAIDGSPHSQAAIDEVAQRDWPTGTEIEVLTVIHTKWPEVGDPVFFVASAHAESLREQRRDAPTLLERAVEQIRTGTKDLTITANTLEGVPHEVIVREAEDFGADLIVLGSHGYGPIRRAILGSVAAAVAVEAPCAVEIIRLQRPAIKATQPGSEQRRADTEAGALAHRE